MSRILQLEAKPLGKSDLRRMLGKQAAQVTFLDYNDLSRFRTLEQAFQGKQALIILLAIETPNAPRVGHWILMLNYPKAFLHFDPYGLSLGQELAITHEKPYLQNLVKQASKPMRESRHRFQKFRSHVDTCGRWCVFRFLHKALSENRFVELVDDSHMDPDAFVTKETMNLQREIHRNKQPVSRR